MYNINLRNSLISEESLKIFNHYHFLLAKDYKSKSLYKVVQSPKTIYITTA